jgi:DNA-directed RNA polymerase subunit E'/Rpb7
MDPLFERRELTKKVHILSKFLQQNMQASILGQLKMNYEGKCSSEGFVQRNSITVAKYSLGRSDYTNGGVNYDVQFQADVCFPHAGQIFKAPVTTRSKIGIHAETPPIKILIPRDLHIGNEDFENVKEGDQIEFEVVGTTFKQQDRDIIVLGKLKSRDRPVEDSVESEETIIPVVDTPLEDVKQIVTTPEAPKKRKLKQNVPSTENELFSKVAEGESKGAD